MKKSEGRARDRTRRGLSLLLSVALATGGPWQAALAEEATTVGDPVVVLTDNGAGLEAEPGNGTGLEVAPPDGGENAILVEEPARESAREATVEPIALVAQDDGNAEEPLSLTAQSGTSYYDPADGQTKTPNVCIYMQAPGDREITLRDDWYTFDGSPTYTKRVSISGNVNLILPDGQTLTCNEGILVPQGSSLTIWAQSTDKDVMGKLVSTGTRNDAGIGGGDGIDGGSVTINGGRIEATGGSVGGAGIGGGRNARCGAVAISGGEVTARAGWGAAGIGGTLKATNGNISITGGTVYAYGGSGGAGIGSGRRSDCENNITIENATVTAYGSISNSESKESGAGIGAGMGEGDDHGHFKCTLTITNATVTAKSHEAAPGTKDDDILGGAGIGAGSAGDARDGRVIITDSVVTAIGGTGGAGIGGGAEGYGDGGEGVGLVEVKGLKTVVVAQAGYGYCSAIGHGDDDSYMGRLSIAGGLKVRAGNDGTNYERTFLYRAADGGDERVGACNWRRSARIEACDHPDATIISVTGSGHLYGTCLYCNHVFMGQDHSYDDGGTCTVCGYKYQDLVSISFDAGGGAGEMKSVTYMPEFIYSTPGCEFEAPAYKAFAGWELVYDGTPPENAAEGIKQPGERFLLPPVESLTLRATWTGPTATVTFGTGTLGTGEYTGTMAPAVAKKGEKYPLPGCGFVPTEAAQAHFIGWEVSGGTPDAGFKFPYDRIDVTGDVTATAQWSRYWLVTYDPANGGAAWSREVDGGDTAPRPNDPVREGFEFKGWTLGGADYDFAQPVTGNITLVAVWEKTSVALMSHSLTLSGAIGVDYFMDLSSLDDATRQASYMEFVVGTGRKRTTHVATFDAGKLSSDGNGYFGFSCPTTSVQMADKITATFHYGDESLELPDYSIKAYVEGFDAYQAEHATDGKAFDDKSVALIHAIADYGHFAQPYLSAENGWAIGADYAEMPARYTSSYEADLAAIKSALAASAVTKPVGSTPVASATMRLYLDSGTSVEAILAPADGESFSDDDVAAVTGSFPGRAATVRLLADGRISVRVDGVSAHLLATPLVVSYGGEEVLRASALSFANAVVQDTGSTTAARDAMCALYRYYEAAAAFRG